MRKLTVKQKALLAAKIAKETKAEDIVVLDMRKSAHFCDFFVICSASSTRRAYAISEAIEDELSAEGFSLAHNEGRKDSLWILLDFADVVVHIFSSELRSFYNIEKLWPESPRLKA